MRYRRIGLPMSEATRLAKQSPGLPAPPQPPFVYDYFVSPTGSAANPGTLESPWTLAYAISGAGGLIVPGVHIGLRGGQYIDQNSKTFTIDGTIGSGYDHPSGKIIWRNYNGEHAEWVNDKTTGSETIRIQCRFNWFWGIDGWRKYTNRYSYPGPGTNWYIENSSEDGTKCIHCWGHEGSNAFYTDTNVGNVEIYGSGSYHSGVSTDPRAHGFYLHHTRDSGSTGSRLKISEHISFDHLGNCGQIYASNNPEKMDDIDVLGLIAWGGGRVASTTPQVNLSFGGTDGANIPMRDLTVKHIISWNPVGYGRSNLRFFGGGSVTGESATLEDGYFVGGTPGAGTGRLSIDDIDFTSFAARRNTMINLEQTQIISTFNTSYTNWTWEDNAFFGSDPTSTRWRSAPGFTDRTWDGWKTYTGLGNAPGHADTAQTSLPATTKVFVRPVNKYEYGRGHVCYFNYASLGRIPVDLSSFLAVGDNIVVRNAQDYWGATIPVYDAPSAGNVVTTWTGVPVYFPTTGVTPPAPYGFNNAAQNAWVNQFDVTSTAPFFDLFIVSVT